MSFDPSTVNTQLAALQVRCDVFTLTSQATTHGQLATGSRYMAYLAPVTTTPVLIMWAALYRGLRLTESYVTDSTRLQQGYAAALTGADEYLNLIDLRLNSLGAVQ